MKKLLSVLLSVCIILSLCIPASASDNSTNDECDCGTLPVILVCGVGALPFYKDAGTENESVYFPPTVDIGKIVLQALKGIFMSVVLFDFTVFSDTVSDIALDILGEFGCNEKGEPAYNVSHVEFPKSMDNYPELYDNAAVAELYIVKSVAEYVGEDHVYCYNYDWRQDPVKNSKKLDAYIDNVLLETGHEKVRLVACSMGGLQTLTYFGEFGNEKVDTAVFLSSAHNGLLFVGNLFAGDFVLDQHDFFFWLKTMKTGKPFLDNILDKLLTHLADSVLLRIPFRLLNRLGTALNETAVDKVLKNTFATMPGMWSFVRSDKYEAAKKMLLDDASDGFITITDYFQENIRAKADDILKNVFDKGTKLIFVSHYDMGVVPVTSDADVHGDALIETVCTSGGATIAKYGDTLGKDYTQANACCEKNHISPDNIIDASTCLFPDYTWFFKGIGHVGFDPDSSQHDFLEWILSCETQPTVFDNELYPQFM